MPDSYLKCVATTSMITDNVNRKLHSGGTTSRTNAAMTSSSRMTKFSMKPDKVERTEKPNRIVLRLRQINKTLISMNPTKQALP